MSKKPEITAVVCTLNRSPYLRKALASLVSQTPHKERYEILVVDNGSTDETKSVVLEEFAATPNLRYIHEPIPGLSHARNTGWKNASGEYVAYLDDDAVADSKWLESFLQAFERFGDDLGCVGGRIEPIWEAARPEWLPDEILPVLGVFALGTDITLEPGRWVCGGNSAYPQWLLKKLGGFDTQLGRKPNSLMSNEEILIQERLDRMGLKRAYCEDALIWHHIQKPRLNKRWILRRGYWQGVSEAIVEAKRKSLSRKSRLHIGAYRAKAFMLSERLKNLWLRTDSPEEFWLKYDAVSRCGGFLGMLGWLGVETTATYLSPGNGSRE